MSGDTSGSLLSAPSRPGPACWGPLPGVPLSASRELQLLVYRSTGFRKGDQPGFNSGPVTNKQRNFGQRTSRSLRFSTVKAETKFLPSHEMVECMYPMGVIYMKCRGLAPNARGCLINGTSLLRQTESAPIRDYYYRIVSLFHSLSSL